MQQSELLEEVVFRHAHRVLEEAGQVLHDAGFATPLIAAVAMSSSSLLVTANAFRLRALEPEETLAEGPSS